MQASFGFGAFGASGSYDEKHLNVKQVIQGQKTSMLQMQLKHHAYTLMVDFNTGLQEGFVKRLSEIVKAIADGFFDRARYLVS